jgi:hypothetical protein
MEDDVGVMSDYSQGTLTALAERFTSAFRDGSTLENLRDRLMDRGMLFSPAILQEVETLQTEMIRDWGYGGDSLKSLHSAVITYPGMRPVIAQLCDAEEALIDKLQQELATRHNVELPSDAQHGQGGHDHGGHSHGNHGHSHGGQPCNHAHGGHDHPHGNHGHSHGGQPCNHAHGGHDHSHGNHGHSHGGVPCTHNHGHGGMNMDNVPLGGLVAQQIATSLVRRSFSSEQLEFIQRLQMAMMQGKMPAGDDQLRAMQIQQTMMKKLQNIGPLVMQGIDALDDADRDALYDVERKMRLGQRPGPEDEKILQGAQDEIAEYIATMGPMLAQLRAQQQAQRQEPQSVAPKPAEQALGAEGELQTESKKKD